MRKERDYIFEPTKEGLPQAKQRRIKRWVELENQFCSKEDELERGKAEVHVFESMKIVRERANQCIKGK